MFNYGKVKKKHFVEWKGAGVEFKRNEIDFWEFKKMEDIVTRFQILSLGKGVFEDLEIFFLILEFS